MQFPYHNLWMSQANVYKNNPRISILLLFNMVWKQAYHILINLKYTFNLRKKNFKCLNAIPDLE